MEMFEKKEEGRPPARPTNQAIKVCFSTKHLSKMVLSRKHWLRGTKDGGQCM